MIRPWLLLGWTLVLASLAFLVAIWLTPGFYNVSLFSEQFQFKRAAALWLLLAMPLMAFALMQQRNHHRERFNFSGLSILKAGKPTWRVRLRELGPAMQIVAVGLIAVALARPQSIHARSKSHVRGIDIVLALDMSLSMQAEDIVPNRFAASQAVVNDFISRRPNDRIGAVVFGSEAYTAMPLTTDKTALVQVINELELNLIDGNGTAIGNAIGTAINRLKGGEKERAKSRIIILLTDGTSNAGQISPLEAAELAVAEDIKIYTILMGVSDTATVSKGKGLLGAIKQRGTFQINPELLEKIAEKTGAAHYSAGDRADLERSFHEILNKLKKSDIEDAGVFYGELYPLWTAMALFLLLFRFLFERILMRRLA